MFVVCAVLFYITKSSQKSCPKVLLLSMLSVGRAWAGEFSSQRCEGESWPERCMPRMCNLPQYVFSLCLLGSWPIYSALRFILINALYIITLRLRQGGGGRNEI